MINVPNPRMEINRAFDVNIQPSSIGYSIQMLEPVLHEHFNLDYFDLDDEREMHALWTGPVPARAVISQGHAWTWWKGEDELFLYDC